MSKLLCVSISILIVMLIAHSLLSSSILGQDSIVSLCQGLSATSKSKERPNKVGTSGSFSFQKDDKVNTGRSEFGIIEILWSAAKHIDEELTVLLSLLPVAKAQDVYMTAYFDGACPDGWELDDTVLGRFIHSSPDEASIGQMAGETVVTLTAIHMPAHTHKILAPKSNPETYKNIEDAKFIVEEANYNTNIPDNVASGSHQYQLVGSDELPTLGEVSFSGGGQAHQNMPPYIERLACKIKSSQVVTVVQLQAMEASLKAAQAESSAQLEAALKEEVKKVEEAMDNKLEAHKEEMNKKFEDFKSQMLPFHILACVSFGCFVLSIIFWLVILKKVKTPQYNSKVLYSPRTTRP